MIYCASEKLKPVLIVNFILNKFYFKQSGTFIGIRLKSKRFVSRNNRNLCGGKSHDIDHVSKSFHNVGFSRCVASENHRRFQKFIISFAHHFFIDGECVDFTERGIHGRLHRQVGFFIERPVIIKSKINQHVLSPFNYTVTSILHYMPIVNSLF